MEDEEKAGSCGADQVGTHPECTDCGADEVPNDEGTECVECPEGQAEATRGRCTEIPTDGRAGHCTRRGDSIPGAEVYCRPLGRVLTNGRCERRRCPANSTDENGVCICNVGHMYDNTNGAGSRCAERTAELCGPAPDPGTCGDDGTWDDGTATCNCDDGYEQSGDGQSCVPCPEDTAGTAGACERCGEGEVPNSDRTTCTDCPHGEATGGGVCNPDPCADVECTGDNTHCSEGECVCDTDHEDTDDDGHCSPVDPCAGVLCSGDNTRCSFGVCVCSAGHEDTDDDGDCAPIATACDDVCCAGANTECSDGLCVCLAGHHDPDGDGDCEAVGSACDGIVCADPKTHCSGGLCVCNAGHEDRGGVCALTACTNADVDAYAERILKSIPQEPWEEGHVYRCIDGAVTLSNQVSSKDAYDNDRDVCELTLQVPGDAIAMAHSHPYFRSRHRGVNCRGRELDTGDLIGRQNMANRNFSRGDRSQAEAAGLPFYLVVPLRNEVKVYSRTKERNDSCVWETRTDL